MDNVCLLVLSSIAVVAVVDHFEKVIELEIIIQRAKRKDLIGDSILIMRIWMLWSGSSIINKEKAKDVKEDLRALARLYAPPAFAEP